MRHLLLHTAVASPLCLAYGFDRGSLCGLGNSEPLPSLEIVWQDKSQFPVAGSGGLSYLRRARKLQQYLRLAALPHSSPTDFFFKLSAGSIVIPFGKFTYQATMQPSRPNIRIPDSPNPKIETMQ